MTNDPTSNLTGGRCTTAELVARLRRGLAARGIDPSEVLVHEERLPARPPAGELLRPRLPAALAAALQARGVRQLYTHQVAAVQAARAGRDFVVTTPTASGKTFCFNLPVLERALADPTARALYLYPTKALLGDQLRGLQELLADLPSADHLEPGDRLRVERLDGDVPPDEREWLRAAPPTILLANPDIVHHDVLARSHRWRTLLSSLAFVVLDELHAYRGVFGAHVALILRRLLRLAARAGAHPTVIAASATIANPAELAERLVGREFLAIAGDGAGAHARRFIFWQPPLWARPRGAESGERRSAGQEAVWLFVELLRAGRTAILFGRTRLAVERMLAQARAELEPGLAARVSGYKAGYTPAERRQIEADLREGRLRGVVATNALELGIDIGALDAAVLAGYPGSVMSTWQQAGRVGRRGGDEALVVLVGADDALDQYYLSHPGAFFGQPVERAVVDPGNEPILLSHLLCAAAEAPLGEPELAAFPSSALRLVDRLVCEGLLRPGQPWRVAEAAAYPHRQLSIRGVGRQQYEVTDGQRTLATAEPPHLYRECYPGAVYLHQGAGYRVESIDATARQVRVRREPADARTEPVLEVSVRPQGEALQQRVVKLGELAARAGIGPLVVEEEVAAFRETPPHSRTAVVKTIDPPLRFTLRTVGLWLDVPESLAAARGGLHAAEHALVNALPIALLCDRRDIGSISEPAGSPGGRIYVFDQCEGGIGLAEKAYLLLEELAQAAADLLAGCRCAAGCPGCVHLAGCPSGNADLDKAGGLALLRGQVRPLPATRRGYEQDGQDDRDEQDGRDDGPKAESLDDPGNPERPVRSARSSLEARLRRIGEASLRERLAGLGDVAVGDVLDYVGIGPVVVREVGRTRERVLVQFPGSPAQAWVALRELRRPAPGS